MPTARVTVEIEWAPSSADLEKIHDGDASADFAQRSFERQIRHWLDAGLILGRLHHYQILHAPEILPYED